MVLIRACAVPHAGQPESEVSEGRAVSQSVSSEFPAYRSGEQADGWRDRQGAPGSEIAGCRVEPGHPDFQLSGVPVVGLAGAAAGAVPRRPAACRPLSGRAGPPRYPPSGRQATGLAGQQTEQRVADLAVRGFPGRRPVEVAVRPERARSTRAWPIIAAISGDQSSSLDSEATRARSRPELPPGIDDRQVLGELVRTCGAADQVPQELVALRVHGDRRRCRVFPVGVIPQMGKQGLGRLVYGKAGDVLGHEVLTDRPVDEAAQGLAGVDVGRADGA